MSVRNTLPRAGIIARHDKGCVLRQVENQLLSLLRVYKDIRFSVELLNEQA
jgi:hypothetical protein